MIRLLVLMLAMSAGSIFAVDYSGTYKGEALISNGKVQNTLVLQIDGKKLTGTLTNQFGVLPIRDGSVDDKSFYFYVVVKDEGDDFRMVYRGRLFEDEIQFRIEAGERQLDLIVKKTGDAAERTGDGR